VPGIVRSTGACCGGCSGANRKKGLADAVVENVAAAMTVAIAAAALIKREVFMTRPDVVCLS
jgi:hypothetical protein